MFGRSKNPAAPSAPVEEYPSGKKDHPTPRRKVAEAANKRPLVVDDRRAAGREARTKAKAQRDVEYKAMLTGDERHMPARDAGPVKRFVRDYVDSRFDLGAYFLPIAVLFLLVALLANVLTQQVFLAVTGLLYLYVVIVVVDEVVLWVRLRKALVTKFGPGSTQGNLMYAALRATQLPRTRMPRPMVKHGGVPVTPKAPKA